MAQVFELVAEANREEIPGAPEAVKAMLEILGLSSLSAEQVVDLEANLTGRGELNAQLEAFSSRAEELLAEREKARAARDFERADAIRDELAELGWEVRDSAEGAKLVPRG